MFKNLPKDTYLAQSINLHLINAMERAYRFFGVQLFN